MEHVSYMTQLAWRNGISQIFRVNVVILPPPVMDVLLLLLCSIAVLLLLITYILL